ncbi:MAG: ribonuclease Z [Thermoleophilia bacterium]|nr:ribonuclease Z [Thermoleophilia bacterium]
MDLDVIFLGTGGSVPSATRQTAATLIRRGGERILVDCGEGTQRRLMQSIAGLPDLDVILITHGHADHILGLPGLLRTFALRERTAPLSIYGPEGIKKVLQDLDSVIGKMPFPLAVVELAGGAEIACSEYRLEAIGTRHRVPSLGWALVEDDRPGRFDVEKARAAGVPDGPLNGMLQRGETITLDDGTVITPEGLVGETRFGRTIVLSGDTRPCDSLMARAVDCDLLIHEATFLDEELDRARDTHHSTAREAAELAAEARVRMLALTHLSMRSPPKLIKAEAEAIHENVVVPRDLDLIELPFRERGDAVLIKNGGRDED